MTADKPWATASTSAGSAGRRPRTNPPTRSRNRDTPCSSDRNHSLVPTTSCHRASTSPRSSDPSDVAWAIWSAAVAYAAVTAARSRASAACCSSAAVARSSARRDTSATAPSHVSASAAARKAGSVAGPGEHVRDRPDRRLGQQPVLELDLRDDDDRGGGQARVGEHLPQVVAHRGLGTGVHPVEHEREVRPAARGVGQQLPRHGVGVPRGGGDEQPDVRGPQQLGGQDAVALLDGVHVGCVQQGEAHRDRLGRDQPEPRARAGQTLLPRRVRAGQRRQHPVRAEPAHVQRVVHEHRPAGRGAQHPRRADLRADQRVDHRRLARAGGAADDHEQRRAPGSRRRGRR